jgi:outer membrane lipoprotein-sorting protein
LNTIPAARSRSHATRGFPAVTRLRSTAVSITFGLCFVAILLTGCDRSNGSREEKSAGDASGSSGGVVSGAEAGKKILLQMAAAYCNATGYHDRGELKLTIRGANNPHSETIPFAVAFSKPNKLRVEAYAATLAIDGKEVVGKIVSPDTNDLDGQVLVLEAPAALTAEALLEYNGLLQGELSRSTEWPFTVDLLLDGERAEKTFQAAERVAVLPSKTIDGRECHVVQIESDDGTRVWWVDKEDSLLRRFEHPVNGFAQFYQLNPSEVSIVADFTGATFTPPAEDRFTVEIAEDAQRVKFFVPPPVLPPSKLIGEPSPSFAFDTFSGADFAEKGAGKLTPESLSGKAAMFLVTDLRDEASLRAFGEMARRFQSNENAALYLVLTDTAEALPDSQLKAVMKQRAPAYSVARAANANAAFGILQPKGVVFIGKTGVVEDAVPLDTFNGIQAGPEILDNLLAGKPWHARALARVEEFRKQYAEQLVLAKAGRLPTAQAAPKSPPSQHRVVSLWKQPELKEPGNIANGIGDNAKLLVIDGPRTVVELDSSGAIAGRHELGLPEGGEIGFLRIGKGRDGRRFFVGSRLFLPKFYVFDESWQLTTTYPEGPIPANEDNPAVGDIQVADVDGDGADDILVGYRGIHGVHLVARDGQRRWTNRAVFEVSRLAVAPGEDGQTAMLVGSPEALTAVLDSQGKERGRWPGDSGPFVFVAISPPLAGNSGTEGVSGSRAYLGIRFVGQNQFAAVALSATGQPIGQYVLPPGVPSTQIEAVTWGRVVGDADHWTVAAPDGSIHFLATDGKPIDRFALGSLPTGISATTIDSKPALVVATKDGGVEALRFERAEAIEPAN